MTKIVSGSKKGKERFPFDYILFTYNIVKQSVLSAFVACVLGDRDSTSGREGGDLTFLRRSVSIRMQMFPCQLACCIGNEAKRARCVCSVSACGISLLINFLSFVFWRWVQGISTRGPYMLVSEGKQLSTLKQGWKCTNLFVSTETSWSDLREEANRCRRLAAVQ
jgi:hypothetical protein